MRKLQLVARWAGPLWITGAAGSYCLVAGLISFLGWAADLRRLTDWGNNGISIQPNTSIAAFASGAALLALTLGARKPGALLGLLAGFIGATALFQHISGLALDIDGLFLFDRTWGGVATVAPGRMGPPGATSFTLIGIAMLVAALYPSARRWVPRIGLVVMANAMLSLIGYIFGAGAMFSQPHLTAIAFQTATMIFALGLGLVAAIPDHHPALLFCEEGAGSILFRRALLFIVLLPIAVGWLCLRGQEAIGYSQTFTTALLVLVLIGLLAALLWFSARALHSRELAQRQAESAREHSERELLDFFDNASVGLHWVGPDGVILRVNQAELDMLGYSRDEYLGRKIADFHVEQGVIAEILDRLAQGETLHECPARMLCKTARSGTC